MYGSEQNNGPYTQRSTLSHEQRINKIFDKLNNIKNDIDTNRDRQMNTIENRLESLFDRLEQFQSSKSDELSMLKEEVRQIEQHFDSAALKHKSLGKGYELKRIQDRYTCNLQTQMYERKQVQIFLSRIIDQKMNNMMVQLALIGRNRQQTISQLKNSLAVDLPRLASLVDEEEKERESCDTEIMEEISEGLEACSNEVASITEVREESEAGLYEMLRDVVNRVGDELAAEKKARVKTEQSILVLIEGMCDKVSEKK